jgi:predicted PhzF superfamily epimerase YddE/YHI9
MKLNFATLDVFTATRFAGNSLAVVFDAGGPAVIVTEGTIEA